MALSSTPKRGLLSHHLYLQFLCCGLVFLSGYIYSATIPILAPLVIGKMHRSQEELGFLFAFYAFGSLILTPIIGAGTDRFFPYRSTRRTPLSTAHSHSHTLTTSINFEPRRGLLLFALALCLLASAIYTLAGTYEWLCFVRLVQALMDAFTWIVTLAVWSRFCAERVKQAAWVDAQWDAYVASTARSGTRVHAAARPKVLVPEASFGSTIIVSSHWIGELCSLPISGYLFDRNLWVFGPAVLITLLLAVGWCTVDLGVDGAVELVETAWAEVGEEQVGNGNGYGAVGNGKGTANGNDKDTGLGAGAAPAAEPADVPVAVSDESETTPLLSGMGTATTTATATSGTAHTQAQAHGPFSVLSIQVGLVLFPLFLTIFLAAGLEPTLPSYLHAVFAATPTEVGGVYFFAWTVFYILGMVTCGKVLEWPVAWAADDQHEGDATPSLASSTESGSDVEAQPAKQPPRSYDTWGIYVLVAGIVANTVVSPALVLPVRVTSSLAVAKILEVAVLSVYGFALGFTLAPTLPEMTRVANKQMAKKFGWDQTRTGHASGGGGGGGHGPVVSADDSDEVDMGATLYGIWCFVYSGAMLISQPLSAWIYAQAGFGAQLALYSVLMFGLGVPSMVALLRDEAKG
ncbi:hypothetical protein HDU93_001947 [Gonapodya sp. JEL0774]|nr:hypothetical protein HDU93_001947 [Gonapodya sp. JEL0774]